MAKSAADIIPITVRISAAGLAFANFGSAMLFAPMGERGALTKGTYKTYGTIQEVAEDFATTTETYKHAAIWLGGTPRNRTIMIWIPSDLEEGQTIVDTLNEARDSIWWYISLFDAATYADKATVKLIANWCEQNGSMFPDNQTGANAAAIRNQNVTDDIATELTTLGYRHAFTASNASDAYPGTYLLKHFAIVNYTATDSTITGEFKKSPGLLSEDLKGSEMAAMERDTKRCAYYSTVELQGSQDVGRWLNTITHSTYGEFIDDVFNLDAFINTTNVALFNQLANMTTKLQQTPRGMAVLLARMKQVCIQYVNNGYLGPRNYIDPADGVEKYTEGFEIMTKPEDILDISPEERNARLAAPIRVMLFRAGAIHSVPVTLDIY